MAWTSKAGKVETSRPDAEVPDWIHQMSVEEATEQFRESLKKHGLHAENQDSPAIVLAHVAVMRGLTRRTARLIVQLMERREAEGKLTWYLGRDALSPLGLSMGRLMAAYIEDPDIPMSRARAGVDRFLRSVSGFDELKMLQNLMPMIVAVRLGVPSAGDSPRKSTSRLPLRADMELSGMCAAAHRQWRVEYLLGMGAEDQALELAHRGRSEKPCEATCALAPHSMVAWLLEPLVRRGRRDEARVLNDRLDALLTPSALYLDAMGCRIHYLAMESRFGEAANLVRTMMPMAREEDASPRQRLKFLEGCERAAGVASDSGEAGALLLREMESGGVRPMLEDIRAWFARRGL